MISRKTGKNYLDRSVCLSTFLPGYLAVSCPHICIVTSVYRYICLCIYRFFNLSLYLSVHLSFLLPVFLSIRLDVSLYPSVSINITVCLPTYRCLSTYLPTRLYNYCSGYSYPYLSKYLCKSIDLHIYLVYLSIS